MHRCSPGRGSANRWRVNGAILGAALAVLVVGVVSTLAGARYYLDLGMGDLQAARADLALDTAPRHGSSGDEIHVRLAAARAAFSMARMLLTPTRPFLGGAGWLPGEGAKLSAASPAADAAFYASSAALDLESGLIPIVRRLRPPMGHGSPLAQVIPLLVREHGKFAAARVNAARAVRSAGLVPAMGDPALDRARLELQTYLPRLQEAATFLALAPELLGASRPAAYLFAWEDPMELRATGGFIGASDFITIRHGVLSHHFAGRVPSRHEIDTALVPLPEAVYTPETYWVFCDANWSPDFRVSARLERWLYGEDTGRWAQGVIDFVDTAIPNILRATGPLYLPSYRHWVTAENVIALAQQYINGTYKGPVRNGLSDTVRKQFFRHVMDALQKQLQALPATQWPAVIRVLAQAIVQRDIQIYSRRPEIESALAQAGAGGGMLSTPGDYFYVVDDNRSYNKINPYVHEWVTHVTTLLPGRWLRESLTIRYHVDRSPASLEGYGPGLGQLSRRAGYGPSLGRIGTKHDYQDFLRVYVPAGSVLDGASGLDSWAPERAYGRTQFAGRVFVRAGRTVIVRLKYRVPAGVAGPDARGYRLTVQHQPGSRIDSLHLVARSAQLSDTTKLTVRAPQEDVQFGSPVSSATWMGQDQPRAEIDPYIDYTSLRDTRHPL